MGGGGGSQTIGYNYFLGMHMVATMGPVDALLAIKVDTDKIAWEGHSTGGTININLPVLFGGTSSEGGLVGNVDFLPGGPAQGVNAYLASHLNDSLVPSFRGVTSFVLNQMNLGMNPYIKPWAFRMQRIFVRQAGIDQWYPEKAGIIAFPAVDSTVPVTTYVANLNITTDGSTAGGFFEFTCAADDVVVITKPLAGGSTGLTFDGWSPFSANTENGGSTWVNQFKVTGDGTLIFDNISVSSAGNNFSALYPLESDAYAGVQSTFPLAFTGHTTYNFYTEDPAPNDDRGGMSALIRIFKNTLDMNPAHILRECLTDPDWGMGYNEADIDDSSFTACADTLFSEGMGISLLWDTQTDIQDFVTTILTHIDAAVFVDRTSGLFVMKLIRDDYVVADLLELTEADIDHIEDFKRPQFGELMTSITVQYWDNLRDVQGSTTIQDIALETMQQAVINTTVQYPGFTNNNIATRAAQRDLRSLSAQIASCTIYTDRIAKGLQVGSVFKLTWADYELESVPFRVNGIGYGDGKSNRIRITCMEDIFSLDATVFIPKVPPIWVDPNGPPVAASTRIAFEMPYLELVQQQSQPTTDSALAADNELGYIGTAASRSSSGAINYGIWTDAGSGYVQNATGNFCPTAQLADGIDRMQTTFSIQNGDGIEDVDLGSWVQIDNELMGVTALSSSSITVTRAALDTLPTLHAANAALFFWDKFASGDRTQYEDSESIHIKLTPRTGSGTLDLADAPVDTVVLAHRAIRPYAPGNLKINGTYFPATVVGDVVLTWAHRDRTQETGGTLLAYTDGSVGPETGVTYAMKVYNGANVLVRTVSGITGTTTTYTAANELADGGPFTSFRITLAAERAGFESWQIYDLPLSHPAPIPVVGIFVPDTDIVAKDPHVVAWNDSYFIVGIQGKIDSIQTQGLYRISDSGVVPEYVGQLYDGRTYIAGMTTFAVPAPYEGTGFLMNLHQTPGTLDIIPVHANAIDGKYSIFYGRRDSSLGTNFRWLLAGDNSTGELQTVDTGTAIDTDIMAMLRTSGAITFAWSVDLASGLTMKCWKSTDGGTVWSYQGPCTNWSNPSGGNINGTNKVFQIGTTFVNVGFTNSKINIASDGIAWVDHIIQSTSTVAAYIIDDVAYDGTDLVAIGQVVPSRQYDTHVRADTPVSFIDWIGMSGPSNIYGDKIDATRQLRIVPNGVGILGWGLDNAIALSVSPNAIEPGSLLTGDVRGLGAAAIKTVTGSYLEARTAGNAAINFLQGTTDFSIELWVGEGDAVPGANTECVLFSQNRTGNPQFQNVLLTFKTTTNILRLRTIHQTGASTYANDVDLSVNIGFDLFAQPATHIVATRGTGGRIFLYVNGAQVATRASGAITDLTVTGTAQLGCVWGNTNSQINVTTGASTPDYSMIIDDACVYAHELSSTRVTDHYDTAIADGLTKNRFWKSTDGATWTQVRDVTMDQDFNFAGSGYYLKWDHIVKLSTGFAVYGKDPVSGFKSHVVISTDHGATWGSNTATITSVSLADTQHLHLHSNGTRIFGTLTTRTVSGAQYPQFAYSTDGITFTDIDSTTFPPGSKGTNLIVLDDTAEPRITETGDFRITED